MTLALLLSHFETELWFEDLYILESGIVNNVGLGGGIGKF